MLAAYGVDVLDPSVSMRRVHVLLERLPPHARRGGEVWSDESELLAVLIDHVAELTWVTASIWSEKKVARPKPVPRPKRRAPVARAAAAADEVRRRAAQDYGGDTVKTRSWSDAIEEIAAMPGMVVTREDA
jgi:hypothetical protein